MPKIAKHQSSIFSTENTFLWGIRALTFTLALSLLSYYLYSPLLRQLSFVMLLLSLGTLFWSMVKDIAPTTKYTSIAWGAVLILLTLYFYQRMEFHRFDFSVGDASDYFLAGICSVTYSQDIGYILPLSATISAIGYEVFGIKNLPLAYVIFYASAIPISYFIFRKFQLSVLISFMMTTLLVFSPLSIWYAKSSFSEPIWQILLLILMLTSYRLLHEKIFSWTESITFYTLLFLAPLLRAEGVLLYGFVIFIALYHFWKFMQLQRAIFISIGLFILAASVHLSLLIRPGYLLDRQYSRIIPDVTTFKVMAILYALACLFIGILFLVHLFRKNYIKIKLPFILTLLSIVLKIGVAYLYAIKKEMSFLDMLFIHEYEIAVGNYGIPVTLLIIFGIVLLYIQAIKGQLVALITVMVYTIFYIPYVMQAITFYDPHAFFFYWNRYYFSIFMMIHLFSLGVTLQFIYVHSKKFIVSPIYQKMFIFILFTISISISMNLKLYQIVIHESHLKNSYKFYDWIKDKVGNQPLSLIMDNSVMYRQNIRPDGQEALKYFVYRTFSIYKIPVISTDKVSAEKLYSDLNYTIESPQTKYVLCLGAEECKLTSINLRKVDMFVLPLEWREHFGLSKQDLDIHQGDITKSIVKHYNLHATLYKVEGKIIDTFNYGKEIIFNKISTLSKTILHKNWYYTTRDKGAWALTNKVQLQLPFIKKEKDTNYSILLKYYIFDASKKEPKHITISLGKHILKTLSVHESIMKPLEIKIPDRLLSNKHHGITLDLEIKNNTSHSQYKLFIESIKINKSTH